MSGLKLILPSVFALYLASACAPDLDSLSTSFSSTIAGSSGSGSSDDGGSDGVGGSAVVAGVCANRAKDSNESDVDCGGSSKCDRCATDSKCTANRDCQTDLCKSGHCAEPTCTDKIKNQDETGVDCGGTCKPCNLGVACDANEDCDGEYCADGVCGDHCTSGVLESGEADKDCGGSCSQKCDTDERCNEATDCKSLICVNNTCKAATCSDGIKNQDESATDCGGACSAVMKACDIGLTCKGPGDCASWVCSAAGKCIPDTVTVGPSAMIDDFEDGDFIPSPIDGRIGNWYVYGDGTGIATEDVFAIKRGASLKGLHTTGKDFKSWGSGVGVDLNHGGGDKLPYDASQYSGITFWARAEAEMSVVLALPDIDTDGLTAGRTCTTCDHHYFTTVPLTTSWARYTIAFTDLSLEPGGAPVPTAFKPGALASVQYRFAPGQTYDVYLDDVAFVK